jgi:dTDP-glucose pyrophosphorylase
VKAFLLAAGIGSRLRPITDTTPKCMLEIGGRPLLGIWLDELSRAGVDEVLVNRAQGATRRPAILRAGTARQRRDAGRQPAVGERRGLLSRLQRR